MKMDDVYTKYKDNPEVAMYVVYVREPHAGEMDYKDIEQPETMEARLTLARMTCDEDHVKMPLLIDAMDNAVREAYGGLPNNAVIIDKEGILVEKQGWADAEEIDKVLAGLVGVTATDEQ